MERRVGVDKENTLTVRSNAHCTTYPAILISRVNIAIVARAVLLAMTAQRAAAVKSSLVLEDRLRVAQRRGDDAPIEVDQVCVVWETIA